MERKESGQAGQGQGSLGKVKDMASSAVVGGQGRGRPRIRPFLQSAARRMAGGFTVGQDVLVRWRDGLFYEGRVLRVDEGNDRCQVQFEDKSTYYVLFKDIHSGPAEGEICCCICQGESSEAPNEIVLCDNCGMGYHQQCHNPPIHSSVLQPHVDFFCKLCTFAASRRGGSLGKRNKELPGIVRTGEDVQTLPYKMNLLTWDAQHKTNVEQCYCYCGGPGEWYCKMLQCCRCRQWFHEACVSCLRQPLLYGDRFFMFVCSHCNHGQEYIKRLSFKWVDVAHLALFNQTLQYSHKYYDLDTVIMPWIMDQEENLQINNLLDGRSVWSMEVRNKVESALNGHKSKFVSGREVKKKATLWGLIVRVPPHPPPIVVPLSGPVNDDIMVNLNGRGRKVKFVSPAQCQTPVAMKCVSRSSLDQSLSIMFKCQAMPETNNNRLLNGFSVNQCYNGYTGTDGLSRSNGHGYHSDSSDSSSSDDDDEEEEEVRLPRRKVITRRLRAPKKPAPKPVIIKSEPVSDQPEQPAPVLDTVKAEPKMSPVSNRVWTGKTRLLDTLIAAPVDYEGQNHPFKTDIEKAADLARVKHFESRITHLKKEYASELAAMKISETFKREPSSEKTSPAKGSSHSPDIKRHFIDHKQHSPEGKRQRGTKRKLSVDTEKSQEDSVRRSKRSRMHTEHYQHLLASFPRHMPQRENSGQVSRWKWLSVVDQLRYGETFEILARRTTAQGQVQFLLHWDQD